MWSLRLNKTMFVSAGTVSLNEFIITAPYLFIIAFITLRRVGRNPSVGKPKEITDFFHSFLKYIFKGGFRSSGYNVPKDSRR